MWCLWDTISSWTSYEFTFIMWCFYVWVKFSEILPILISHSFPNTSRGRVCNSWARSALFHASETWVPVSSDLYGLKAITELLSVGCVVSLPSTKIIRSQKKMPLDNLKMLCICWLKWHDNAQGMIGELGVVQTGTNYVQYKLKFDGNGDGDADGNVGTDGHTQSFKFQIICGV